jgi:hypothetical protein
MIIRHVLTDAKKSRLLNALNIHPAFKSHANDDYQYRGGLLTVDQVVRSQKWVQ